MSVLRDELVTETSDDYGFKSLGKPIRIVSDYEEKIPYKHINNFTYAPQSGLLAAAGANELVIGKLVDLKKAAAEEQTELNAKHVIDIGDVTSVAFTKDETFLMITIDDSLLFSNINTSNYTTLNSGSFRSVKTSSNIQKVVPCPANGPTAAILDDLANLYNFSVVTGTLNKIASDVLDFSWSPKGKQIAVSKKDGSIVQITLDGTEKVYIPRPDDLEDDGVPISLTWVSPFVFLAVFGEEPEFDPTDDPHFDYKVFVIEHNKATNTNTFKETFDAVPAFGSVWRRQDVYVSTFHNISQSLQSLTILASSTANEVSSLIPSTLIQSADDATRAALPINDDTGNDINAIGLITDVKIKEPIKEPCAGVSHADWLPTVWVLLQDGRVQGWYVYHVHDLKSGTYKQDGPLSFEDELFASASGSTTSALPSPAPKVSPFDAPAAKASAFGSTPVAVPLVASSDNKSLFSQTSAAPSLTSTESKPFSFGSSTNSSAFGSTGLEASKPAFGSSGFGSSGFGTTVNKPAFGNSAFGSAGFGTKTDSSAPAFGSSGFGAKAAAASPFGALGAEKSAFGTSAFGSSASSSSPFASLAGKTDSESKPSPFASIGQPKTDSTGPFGAPAASASPFLNTAGQSKSIFGAKTESSSNPTPFGQPGGDKQKSGSSFSFGSTAQPAKTTQDTKSPFSFGAPLDAQKTESTSGLFGSKKNDSPFASLSSNKSNADTPSWNLFDKKSTDPFTTLGGAKSEEQKNNSPFASIGKGTNGSSFGSAKTETTPSTFGGSTAKPPAASGGAMNFGSFLGGTDEKVAPQIDSEEEFNSEDDYDENSSDEDGKTGDESDQNEPVMQPVQAAPSKPATSTSQGPTSFGTASFGQTNTSSGFSGFGSSSFGSSGFKFGEKPKVQEIKPAQAVSVGSSGFGAFAKKPVDFGSKNIFAEAAEKDKGGESSKEQKDIKSVTDAEDEKLETDMSSDGVEDNDVDEQDKVDASQEDLPESSFDGFEDSQDHSVGRDSTRYEDEEEEEQVEEADYEKITHSDEFDTSGLAADLSVDEDDHTPDRAETTKDEADEDEDESDEEVDQSETDLREGLEGLNMKEKVNDPEISDVLQASLNKTLSIEGPDSAESLKSSKEEDLYREAQKLNADGSSRERVSDEDDQEFDAEADTTRTITVTDKAIQSETPSQSDASVHAAPEVVEKAVDATLKQTPISVQTNPVEQATIGIEAFEGDEVYAGSFDLPKLVSPYVHLGDIKYPPLSHDEVARQLETIVYDTDAELIVIEENLHNLSSFITDHMNPSIVHTEASIGHSEQWRLSEATTVNNIIASRMSPASQSRASIDAQLVKLASLKESIEMHSKRSSNLISRVLSLEATADPAIISARDLPFDTQLLQSKVRASFQRTSVSLREAEQKLLALKTVANVFFDKAPTPETVKGIIAHVNDITREYSADTKRLAEEISKLNANHTKILESIHDGQSKLFIADAYERRGATMVKVEETRKRILAQRRIADEFASRLVMEVTSHF